MDDIEALAQLDDLVGWLCDNGPEGWQDRHGWWSDTWDCTVDISARPVRDSEDDSVDDTQIRVYDQSEIDEAYACALEMKAEIEEYLRQQLKAQQRERHYQEFRERIEHRVGSMTGKFSFCERWHLDGQDRQRRGHATPTRSISAPDNFGAHTF